MEVSGEEKFEKKLMSRHFHYLVKAIILTLRFSANFKQELQELHIKTYHNKIVTFFKIKLRKNSQKIFL